jgi:adenylate cyclase
MVPQSGASVDRRLTMVKATRKLAAILAADVVGYARLVRADEEGTLAALQALRRTVIDPKIAEYGGRIVKLMGDGMLAEFGSVVDAVTNAVDVQRAVAEVQADVPEGRRIRFRVGVNLGDVVIDGEDIHGDGVNLAARLEALAPPDGICISDAVHEQVRDKLAETFEDMGEQTVKNIDRPLRVWQWSPQAAAATVDADAGRGALPLPDKPSIAVLPFDNISGDPDQDYFADGITEDIITELSRFRDIFVIARNSSFTYKGRAVKVQTIRGELGVRYVVEGSVRKAGDRVRVNVQLIDSETGNHIWAERYDRSLDDIFEVQDELTRTIVATLPGRVGAAELDRVGRRPPRDMAAYECLVAGKIHHHLVTREDNAAALRLLQKAIELDPGLAEAYAWKACTAGQALQFGFSDDPPALETEATAAIKRALSLDPNNVECHRLLCEVYMERHDLEQARVHGARAIALNPNDPRLVAQQGELLTWLGRPEEAVEWIRKALRLDPHGMAGRAHLLGRALYGIRQYAEALDAYRQLTAPRYAHSAAMAACFGQLGLTDDAAKQAAAVLRQRPDFTTSAFVAALPYADPADRDHFADGLRKAGLPE